MIQPCVVSANTSPAMRAHQCSNAGLNRSSPLQQMLCCKPLRGLTITLGLCTQLMAALLFSQPMHL